MSERSIGIFDSGVGGLTIAKEIIKLLPQENIIYFADNLHNPYGPAPLDEIKSYVDAITGYLVEERQCKAVVIACNTATAAGLDTVRGKYEVPIWGAVEAAAREANQRTKTGRLGVLATEGTVNSGIYSDSLKRLNAAHQVFSVAAPDLVTLVEAGDFNSPRMEEAAKGYLVELMASNIDTLILGCTHFAYLTDVIQKIVGPGIDIVYPGERIALEIKEFLAEKRLLNQQPEVGVKEFWSSDKKAMSPLFLEQGPLFLGWEMPDFLQSDLFGKEKKTIVLGVIGSDVHAVGNKILHYALEEAGFKVINIGVMASQREFIEAAIETNADVILVSSLYGHGEMDCQGFRDRCIEAGIGDILLYVGGNLVVGKQDWSEVREKFKAMGFDRVYPPGTLVEDAIKHLNSDLNLKSRSKADNGNSNSF